MDAFSVMSSSGLLWGRLQVSLKIFVSCFGRYLWFCEVLCGSVVGTCGQGSVPEAPKHFCRAVVVCAHRMLESCCAVMGRGFVCWRPCSGCMPAVKYFVFLGSELPGSVQLSLEILLFLLQFLLSPGCRAEVG